MKKFCILSLFFLVSFFSSVKARKIVSLKQGQVLKISEHLNGENELRNTIFKGALNARLIIDKKIKISDVILEHVDCEVSGEGALDLDIGSLIVEGGTFHYRSNKKSSFRPLTETYFIEGATFKYDPHLNETLKKIEAFLDFIFIDIKRHPIFFHLAYSSFLFFSEGIKISLFGVLQAKIKEDLVCNNSKELKKLFDNMLEDVGIVTWRRWYKKRVACLKNMFYARKDEVVSEELLEDHAS